MPRQLNEVLSLILFIVFLVIMVGTPLVILVLGIVNFRRDRMRQAKSALQALAALGIWGFLTFVIVMINLMIPFTVHYPISRSDELKETAVFLVGGLIYALAGGALIYWTKRQRKHSQTAPAS
jgi:protein-S-isoprenylcysteine O-methyltransferase Ste14